MKHIDTPAGKFQVLCNGIPIEFECHPYREYAYYDESSMPIASQLQALGVDMETIKSMPTWI